MRAMSIPFFTTSPSSTLRSTSFPEVLNEMSTRVSSILPDSLITFGSCRPSLPDHRTAATATPITKTKMMMIRFRMLFHHRLNFPHRARHVDSGEIVVVQRADHVLASPNHPRLRVSHLDAVRDACFVAPARTGKLVFGKCHALSRRRNLRIGGFQTVDGRPYLQFDLVAQIGAADPLLAHLRRALPAASILPPAIENRDAQRHTVLPRRQLADVASDGAVVGESNDRRQSFEFHGAVRQLRGLFSFPLGLEIGP